MPEDKRFQFGGPDEAQDGPIFQEDSSHRRIERLSRLVTVLMVLLPCLFGLLLYFGYRDLNARMSRSATSGVQEVQKISEDILSKFNEISERLSEYETQLSDTEKALQSTSALLDQKSADYESADAALITSAKTNSESIEKLVIALDELRQEKLDKNQFTEFDATLKETLTPLNNSIETLAGLKEEIEALAPLREEIDSLAAFRQEIEEVSERLTALENSLGKDLNAFATYVEKTNKDLDQIQSSMSAMSKDKVGQEKLKLELLKVRKSNRLTVLKEITKVQKTLNVIREKVEKLERTPPRSSILRPPSRTENPASVSRSGEVSEQELVD